ncbi:MAG TPA: lamin tail domain-containing protein [Luteibaculaceae bacterium]|nr:lamin tail domain-containing protein [Luteibaculaceae bacterium]
MRAILFLYLWLTALNALAQNRCRWTFNQLPDSVTGLISDSLGRGLLFPQRVDANRAAGWAGFALQTSAYPAQGTQAGQAGIRLQCKVIPHEKLTLSFRLRASSTANNRMHITQPSLSDTAIYELRIAESSVWIAVGPIELKPVANGDSVDIYIVSMPDSTGQYQPVSGAQYRSSGTLRWDDMVITGSTDTEGPQLISVQPMDARTVKFTFNEALDSSCLSNLSIQGLTLPILSDIHRDSTGHHYHLTSQTLLPHAEYFTVCWFGLRDSMGNTLIGDPCRPLWYNASKRSPVITEIMYNDPNDDAHEFIELYNPSDDTLKLGLMSVLGVQYIFDSSAAMIPGEYLLLVKDAQRWQDFNGPRVIQWTCGTLSNGGECIALINQARDTLSRICFDNTGSWPRKANGLGSSLERRKLTDTGVQGEHWRDSFTPSPLEAVPHWRMSPGFGFESNKVGFKLPRQAVWEGDSAVVQIALKQEGRFSGIVLTRLSYPDGSVQLDTQIADVNSRKIRLWIADDSFRQPISELWLSIADANNTVVNGLDSTVLEIFDNDTLHPRLCITEVMANNRSYLNFPKGYMPWVELHNPNLTGISTSVYTFRVTDRQGQVYESPLPGIQMEPLSYRVVPVDTNHQEMSAIWNKLPVNGALIQLMTSDGVEQSRLRYGNAFIDRSYEAERACDSTATQTTSPSPGAAKGTVGLTEQIRKTNYNRAYRVGEIVQSEVVDSWQLWDVTGKMAEKPTRSNAFTIPDLPAGIYILGIGNHRYKILVTDGH